MTFEGSVNWHICYRCCCRCCCLRKCCLVFSFKINQLRRKVIHKTPIHWESHFEAHDDMWHRKLLDKVLSTPMISRRNQRTQIIYTRNLGKFLPFFRSLLSPLFCHAFPSSKCLRSFLNCTYCVLFRFSQSRKIERENDWVRNTYTRGKASFPKCDEKEKPLEFCYKSNWNVQQTDKHSQTRIE